MKVVLLLMVLIFACTKQSFAAPKPEVKFSEGVDALVNDPALVDAVIQTLNTAVGAENVVDAEPQMGAEDFSQYGEQGVPVFMYWLGTLAKPRYEQLAKLPLGPHPLHSSLFYPDPEPTLATGFKSMTAAALSLLAKKNQG